MSNNVYIQYSVIKAFDLLNDFFSRNNFLAAAATTLKIIENENVMCVIPTLTDFEKNAA